MPTEFAPGLSFVSVDVETANRSRGSICSIGYAVVLDGRIVESGKWLCRPPEPVAEFDGFNVMLHGITPEMVAGEPYFAERLDTLLHKISGRPVVAHNAGFDLGALRTACSLSGLDWPTLDYGCSLVWARRLIDSISYSLPIVAAQLGVALDAHHDAEADAVAAAGVTIALARLANVGCIADLAATVQTRLGRLTALDWVGCCGVYSGGSGHPVPPGTNPDADPCHPLYGEVMVFTGGLATMPRKEAFARAAHVGAVVHSGVTKDTTRLVIGDGFAGTSPDEFYTGKAAKAVRWREKGKPIEVLTEPEFLSYVFEEATSGTRI
jgi:DNA polymerase-3 subunit epsilon